MSSNKTDSNNGGDDGSLREPLLDVEPVPVPMPVAVDAEVVMPAPMPVPADADVEGLLEGQETPTTFDIDETDWDHGEVQPMVFRDCFWAILFLLQLAGVVTLAIMGIVNAKRHGSEWLPSSDEDDHDDDYDRRLVYFVAALLATVVAVPSFLLSLLLGAFSSMLIQISLVSSPFFFFLAFVGSLVTMNCPVALFSLIMSVIGVFYAIRVWHKVPFATANLKIALASIKDNHGLWIIAYIVTVQSYAWIFLWCSAVLEMGVFSPGWVYDNCSTAADNADSDSDDTICTLSTRGKFFVVGMLLSLFWTNQVISNIFHTTIAGVVGTWWFDPQEARSAAANGNNRGVCFVCCGCSTAIVNSWIRSGVHSLGSIAFGSLLVGILKVLQLFVRGSRSQREQTRRMRGIRGTDFVFCLLQFFVEHLERLLEYINAWAFVYVGLYGYDYWTAGKQVGALFKARGWDVIINDNLVVRSLSMMSLFISLITGLIGFVLGFFLLGTGVGALQAFFLGFVLGFSSCQILFGVVTSAVNTVVVCFAESPSQLNADGHDPKHFRELVEAYRTAYPNNCGF